MSSSSFVTKEQFDIFHSIDRNLYSFLVIELWRDPIESMQILALFLWLERMGYDIVVHKILTLPSILINEIADEAMICLRCVNSDVFALSAEIPLIQTLMKEEISLNFFHDNRFIATQGVAKIMSDICMRACSDIMHYAIKRNASQSIIDSQKQAVPSSSFQPPLQHPAVTHTFGTVPEEMVRSMLQPHQPSEVPAEARTMFVTFSKGYPVQDWEVREFLTKNYGNCIESLYMQEVDRNEQSLFARIVFNSVATVDGILNGFDKVKFSINGKHVWARKFVPKRPRQLQPTPPLNIGVPFES